MIGPVLPEQCELNVEIARLRDLDIGVSRSVGRTRFGGSRALTCPRSHLSLVFRPQADRLADLDAGESAARVCNGRRVNKLWRQPTLDAYRIAGSYVGRILKGESLPQP
jgi:hypothetical protein